MVMITTVINNDGESQAVVPPEMMMHGVTNRLMVAGGTDVFAHSARDEVNPAHMHEAARASMLEADAGLLRLA